VPVIDAHAHIHNFGFLPRKHNWYNAMEWAYSRPPYRDPDLIIDKIMPGLADPEGEYLISQMDEAGIDVAVLLPLDYGLVMGEDQEATLDQMHKFYSDIMHKYPDRVISFAGQDPRRQDAVEIFDRAITDFDLRGLKTYPNNGYFPFDPVCYPFYQKCQELGLPILSHIAPNSPPHRSRYSHPLNWGDVIVDFPDLVLWWGHAGYPIWWDECLEVMARHQNSYLEVSLWHRVIDQDEREFVKKLARARDRIGAHRILWGSDAQYSRRFSGKKSLYGFGLKRWVDWWKDLKATAQRYNESFTDEEIEWMLGGNAARCLGLSDEPQWQKRRFNWEPRRPRPTGL
jgi:predicted TIM-barrel fold metal-dependent hydrolase